jgi:hypothetical protein
LNILKWFHELEPDVTIWIILLATLAPVGSPETELTSAYLISKLMLSDAAEFGTSTLKPFKGLLAEFMYTEPPDCPTVLEFAVGVAVVNADVVRIRGVVSWLIVSFVPLLGRTKTIMTLASIRTATTAMAATMSRFLLFFGFGGLYCGYC